MPTPTPVVHHYAPEGVFYLTEDATVRLKAGLKGVVAGTPVKLVKDGGDTLQVTDGQDQFEVKKTQVTNDLDIAAKIAKQAARPRKRPARISAPSRKPRFLKQQHDEVRVPEGGAPARPWVGGRACRTTTPGTLPSTARDPGAAIHPRKEIFVRRAECR